MVKNFKLNFMRTILLTIIIICVINRISAQYPCQNGISTNPLNPINNQLPIKRNTFFNWQDSIYQVQPINSTCVRGSFIESPFYKIDNLEDLRVSKDMKWEDGWELLRRGFGLTDLNTPTTDPVPHVYLILYNKYTGILRVLLKVCRGADYNAAKITLEFNSLTQMKTDLLEFSRNNISALDKKFSAIISAAGSKYINDDTKWFYADFPMMFDPCTCAYKSKLQIKSVLISTSSINLEGGITGDIYTKDVGGKAQIQKPGSFGWKDVSNFVNGKVSTAYGAIDNFVSTTTALGSTIAKVDVFGKASAIFKFGEALKSNAFLQTGLKAVPWLKSAVSLLDVFIGGGKSSSTGPQLVQLLPLAVNLTAKLSGTINLANQYHDIIFTNPGSKDAQLDPDAYPYYNEVLGVFNLVKTPVAFKVNNSVICDDNRRAYGTISNYQFRFDADSFYYVVNPAAGLTIQDMQAAIVIKTRPLTVDTSDMTNKKLNASFQFFEGKDALDNTYKFRTEYFDMKCLDMQIFNYQITSTSLAAQKCFIPYEWNASTDTLYLKLMINLKRNNVNSTTQNVGIILTYPMKTVTDAVQVITPTFATCDSTILPPASAPFVNSFCSSSVYNNIDRQLSKHVKDSLRLIQGLEQKGIAVSPNPNSGYMKLLLKPQKAYLTTIKIVDISGKVVYTNNFGKVNLADGYSDYINSNLSNGTYLLVATTDHGLLKSKFIILKQ